MHKTDLRDRHTLHRHTAARTVIYYIIFACLWIYLSDTILVWIFKDPELLTRAQTIKGWLFVVVTASLLFAYLSHCLQSLRNREEVLEQEREKAQRDMQDRFEQLNTLFDSMNAVVYVSDLTTHDLLYVNRFAADYFGEDWRGQKCYHYLQEGIESPCDFCTNNQLLNNGEPGVPVIWEFHNTKTLRWYECFDKAIRWTDGRLVRLEVALDITERKELEKVKDDLLSSMSHEMRTPLTAISGFAELLISEREVPEQHKRHLEIIYREADKLADLIDRFLDIRRLKINRSRINYEELSVDSLLTKAKESCRDKKEHNDISIECQPGLLVYGNRKELTQVITQLLDNACRYSPDPGQITLVATRDARETSICVTDHGIGIPQHELESIFDPFYRLDTGDCRSTGGVGLGLCVTKDIVALHGGRMEVESTLGEGSSFTVLLPNRLKKTT